jgi:uncharacterized protein YidB (DUF937 family)
MSIFDDLIKNALGGNAPPPTQTQSLLQGAMDLLASAGGVQGITEKFQKFGLGDVVSSWIGTGQNKPISPEQLAAVLGPDKIESLAQQAGIPPAQGASALAEVFPALLDKLTPEGVLPDKSQLMTIGKVILGGLGVAAAAKVAASVFGKKDDEPGAPPAGAEGTRPEAAASAAAPGVAPSRSYTVVSGDTLSKIAKQFYGDANSWKRIFDANREVLNNPDRIFPGQVLRIP